MRSLDAILDRVNERLYPVGPVEISQVETFAGRADLFGPSMYGKYLATSNEVYTVANFRARQFGSLRLRAYDSPTPEKQEISSGPEVDLLHRVNPFWTFARLLRQTELTMCIWGEAFWAVNKTASGVPAEIYWMRPDRVKPIPDPDTWLKGFIYTGSSGQSVAFAADEVIWFRYPNPLDQYAGLSPLAAARLAADVASDAMKANRKMQQQGMTLGGFVVPKTHSNQRVAPFSTEQAQDLEKTIGRQFTGSKNAHRWGVLRFDAEFHSMSVSPKDAEFVEGLNLTFRQICRVYGVPSPLVFDLEHATLTNVRELQKVYWEHAGVPEANFYAYDLEEQWLPMFPRRKVNHLAWDFTQVPALQESESAVWQRDRQQIEVGARTINEVRLERGLPPVAWGDVWWAPVNKAPVSDVEAEPVEEETDEDRSKKVETLNLANLIAAEVADLVGAGMTQGANGHGPY